MPKHYLFKRLIISLIMIFLFLHKSFSQDYSYADPYLEKTFLNPAFVGIINCKSLSLNYQKQYVYDFYSASLNLNLQKINSGTSIVFSNFSQAKNTFNNLYISGIYSYHIDISHLSKASAAIQMSYIQENINPDNLIFGDMINTESGTISENTQESLNFIPTKEIDFSAGTSYFSKKYRYGFSISHIQNILKENNIEKYPTKINFHFAKHFFKNSFENNKKLIRFTPEIIYIYQNKFNQVIVGLLFEKNVFFSKFWLKNNLNFNSFTPVITFGIKNRKLRISYTYGITLSKFITLPISTNQISLTYSFDCAKKRNKLNTIYCTNF